MSNQINWHKVIRRDNSLLFQYSIARSFDNIASAYEIDAHYNHYRYINKDIYTDLNDLRLIEENLENMLLVEPGFPLRKYLEVKKLGQKLLKLTSQVAKKKEFTKYQKLTCFKKFHNLHLDFDPFFRFSYPYGKIFEKRAKFILKYALKKRNQEKNLEKIFENLVIPFEKPRLSAERESLSHIALYLKKVKKENAELKNMISKHIRDFSFLTFNAGRGEMMTKKGTEQEAKKEAKKDLETLKEQTNWFKNSKKKSSLLLKKLNIGHNFKWNIEMMQRYVFLRLYVKEVVEKSYYDLYNLLTEIGKPLNLPCEDIVFLLPEEIIGLISGKRKNYKKIIYKRKQGYALDRDHKNIRILTDKDINSLQEETEKEEKEEVVIQGNVANRGKVEGPVKVIKYSPDCSKVEKDDVLVAPMTTPEFVTALKRAAAIITDEGGITCHAAIVSRELNIPCIIGTKIATKVLKDGDKVEVDANKGIVRKI